MSDVNTQDLRADWTSHPYAGIARRRMDDQLAITKSSLMSACSQSSDPKVRGAYERLKAMEQAAELIAKGVE